MKKFIGAICSALAGALSFVWLSLNWISTKTTVSSIFGGSDVTKGGYTGWDLISNNFGDIKERVAELNGYMLSRIFSIAVLVFAILAILMAVVLLLQSFKILKVKANLNVVNCVILSLFVIVAIVALIGCGVLGKAMSGTTDLFLISGTTKAIMGVGVWLQASLTLLACVACWAMARKADKSSKSKSKKRKK